MLPKWRNCTNSWRLIDILSATYYQATDENQQVVAIKKVYQDKRYKNRELQIMKELCHQNVVSLKHAFYTQGDKVSLAG